MQAVQRPSNRISWPAAYLAATSAQEKFEEVHVVTAKSEFVSKAHELAATALADQVFSEQAVNALARQMIIAQRISVQESVTIDDVGMHVCINADSVEDDNVMWRALDMLADAMYQLDGNQGTITYGEPLAFGLSDVPWMITQ